MHNPIPQRRVRILEQKTFDVTEFEVSRHYDRYTPYQAWRKLYEIPLGAVAVVAGVGANVANILTFGNVPDSATKGWFDYGFAGLNPFINVESHGRSQQNLASPPAGQTAEGIRLDARSLALCGAFDCSGQEPLVPGLTLDMISVCDPVLCPATHSNVSTGEGTTSLVSVTIGNGQGARYVFQSLVPWVLPDITFNPVGITMAASTN